MSFSVIVLLLEEDFKYYAHYKQIDPICYSLAGIWTIPLVIIIIFTFPDTALLQCFLFLAMA